MSGRGGNIIASVRRMCNDTQGTHLSRRGSVRKNKHEGEGMVERHGKEEEKKCTTEV